LPCLGKVRDQRRIVAGAVDQCAPGKRAGVLRPLDLQGVPRRAGLELKVVGHARGWVGNPNPLKRRKLRPDDAGGQPELASEADDGSSLSVGRPHSTSCIGARAR